MRFSPTVLLLGLTALGCANTSPVNPELERAALAQADSTYAAVAGAFDNAGIVALYASDATIYPEDGPAASGTAAITKFVNEFPHEGMQVAFNPILIDVSATGDVGYTVNLAQFTMAGPDGAPTRHVIRDVHLWKKQTDGSWKIIVDIWNTQPPPAAPPAAPAAQK